MIFPLWVEGLGTRRWPYVTTALIIINFGVFLGTHEQIEAESRKIAQIKFPMPMIAAAHPEVDPPADVKPLIASFAQENKTLWDGIRSGNEPPMNLWDRDMREWGPIQSGGELTKLAVQWRQAEQGSVLRSYAFYPYKPTLLSLITANFLHGGWLHLIFNMWFLWLAGTMMEDVWGAIVYAGFYLLIGIAALLAHGATYPHSIVPALGASGAIAGLIGAFLVRFPEVKIDLIFLFFIRIIRFAWPAYFVLPLWLLVQIFWGSVMKTSGGVAYWAHIGGFIFGALIAIALRQMGMERPIAEPPEIFS